MFTEMLQAEIWRKRLEAAGYRVVTEAWPQHDADPAGDEAERVSRPSDPRPSHVP